jgi:hypothetical protein
MRRRLREHEHAVPDAGLLEPARDVLELHQELHD